MAATTTRSDTAPRPDRVARFDAVERALHWANAALVMILIATGAALYAGPLSTLVGRRALVKDVHVLAGLALPVPFALALAGRWRAGFVRDVRALNRFAPGDWRWLRSRGRDPSVRLGKFNPGQKLNAAFVAGSLVVMLATGSIMKWFSPFPDDWRTGATFVHDWVFILLSVAVAGHVWLAVADRDALRAIVRGWVPASWAERRRPRWFEEEVDR